MKKYESSLSENLIKNVENATKGIYKKFDSILHDENLSNEEKKKQIDDLLTTSEPVAVIFDDWKNMADKYLDMQYSTPFKNEDDFKKDAEEMRSKTADTLCELIEDIFITKKENDDIAKAKITLSELGIDTDELNSLSKAEINEIINDMDNPYTAEISEEVEGILNGINVPRKDADNIKRQWKYKVEGKITSGIGELDDFLGIIQPGLDLILKTGAKLFYEGIVDPIEEKFTGNEELGIKSDFTKWCENEEGLKKSYDFLHRFGGMPNTDIFKYKIGKHKVMKDEDHVASYFNQMIVDRINENRANKKDNDGKPVPFEEFKGNAFDETKNMDDTIEALQGIIQDVLAKTRDFDKDGNPIAKPTDAGKAGLNSIMYMTDLFNKKNSPEFKNKFAGLFNFYTSGYTEKFTGNFVEKENYIVNTKENEAQDKILNQLLSKMQAAQGQGKE